MEKDVTLDTTLEYRDESLLDQYRLAKRDSTQMRIAFLAKKKLKTEQFSILDFELIHTSTSYK